MSSPRFLCCVGFLATLCFAWAIAAAQPPAGTPVERLRSYRFGGDRAVLDAVEQWVKDSRSNPARKAAAARALASVLASDAAFDAKQFACRQLALVGQEEQVPALTALLADERLAHYALLALARIPGNSVEDALRKALPAASGRPLFGIMDTLAERHDPKAIPLLAERLASTDTATFEAAAASLGKLATQGAVKSLSDAYERASVERRSILAHALLAEAARLRDDPKSVALGLYELIDRQPPTPAIAAAALEGIVQMRGDQAIPRLAQALQQDDSHLQKVAAGLARDLPAAAATRKLAEVLPTLHPRGQTFLIDALAERGDRAALPVLIDFIASADPAVRSAALRALGSLGDGTAVPPLLAAAASAAAEDRAAARQSLVRLRGAEVDQQLLDNVNANDKAIRIEAIRSLGERRYSAAIPRLVKAAGDPDRTVSSSALRVLREMGDPTLLPSILDLLFAAPAAERDELLQTAGEIARRGRNEDERTGAVLKRLAGVSAAKDRTDLLNLLGQVGGPAALAALKAAAKDPAADVRMVAFQQLAEWPTDEPMADLLAAVRSTEDVSLRAIALRGYARMIAINEQRTPAQALALYREAAALAKGAGDRRLILSGLPKVASLDALEFAKSLAADPEVRAESELAQVEIGRRIAGAYRDQTRAALEPIARESADDTVKKAAADVLALIPKFGEYVTAWEVSPPYAKVGADYSRLFDIPFPPEDPALSKDVPWRLMPAGLNPEQPWLMDLLALMPGEQKVAYLRAAIWSETGRDLVLELGSDDGVKAWWNGQPVLSNNTARAVAPAQEKVKVTAKPGWNQLLLKITQNIMGWSAVARLTNPDGTPAAGLRQSVVSTVGP